VQLRTGQFAEAETSSTDSIAIWEDLGMRAWTVRTSIVLARARMHMRAYRAARLLAEQTVSLAHRLGWERGVSYGEIVLGEVALVEAAFAQAYSTLQESLSDLLHISDDPRDVHLSAWLGLAARGLEHRPEAWKHLVSALDWASRRQEFSELMVALAGIAFLLADEGEVERAIELYAPASRHPFVAKSRWFEDVAGGHLAAVAEACRPQWSRKRRNADGAWTWRLPWGSSQPDWGGRYRRQMAAKR
jgi:tetratricopeptide (TPR) repeat protein